ncbi:MAG: vWA domain-containing protein [Phycisphaerales bacterium]
MTSPVLAISFLTPLAGIIGACIAVPLLLALYFLKLRRRPARISSTLLWESAVRDMQANVPFRMIRPSWLLLLQAIIVALLCLALARPTVMLPGRGGERTIIAIDLSASMLGTDGTPERSGEPGGTRLAEAKRRATDAAMRIVDAGGEVMVVSFAARPQVLTQFTRNKALLRQTIEGVGGTDQPVDFDRAVALLAALTRGDASEEADAEPPARVVIVSDGALERRRSTGATLSADRLEFVRVGPAGDAEKENFGIVALAAQRDYEDPGLVRVFVRVLSTAIEEQTITLTARLSGRVIDSGAVLIPGRGARAASDDGVTPSGTGLVGTGAGEDSGDAMGGQAGYSFEIRTNEAGLLVISHARPDILSSDDAGAVLLLPPASARILVVFPDARRSSGDGALLDALAIVDPSGMVQMVESEFAQRSGAEGFFAGFDLVIFNRVRPERLPPIPSVSFNAGLPIPGLALVEGDGGGTESFAFWDRSHPLMRGVSLGLVQIDDPATLLLPTPGAEGGGAQGGTEDGAPGVDAGGGVVTALASVESGVAIALIERRGVRRIVVAPDLDSTTWWADPSFPNFIVGAIEHLTVAGGRDAGSAFDTGSDARVALPPVPGGVALIPPPGEQRAVDAARTITPAPGGLTSVGILANAGVWTARGEGFERLIPVNVVDEMESSMQTRDELLIAGASIGAGSGVGVAPREIWHWLVACAAALLALEWCVFALRSRV